MKKDKLLCIICEYFACSYWTMNSSNIMKYSDTCLYGIVKFTENLIFHFEARV